MDDQFFWDSLIRSLNKIFHRRPPFSVGDIVRFDPDERTIGWTQDFEGLYPGYTGRVARVEQNWLGEWIIYVDDKPAGFSCGDFRLVQKAQSD